MKQKYLRIVSRSHPEIFSLIHLAIAEIECVRKFYLAVRVNILNKKIWQNFIISKHFSKKFFKQNYLRILSRIYPENFSSIGSLVSEIES